MKLVDYLALIRRRLVLFGAIIGVVALVSTGLTLRKPAVFEGSVRLRAREAAPRFTAQGSFLENEKEQTDLGTEAELVKSTKVASLVIETLGLPMAPMTLLNHVNVSFGKGAVMIINAQALDPVLSLDLANAFAQAYLDVRREDAIRSIERAREVLTQRFQEAQNRVNEAAARVQASAPGSIAEAAASAERDGALTEMVLIRDQVNDLNDSSVVESGFGEVIQAAEAPRLVRDASPTRSLVFGFLLGGPLALAVILLLDSLSDTVRSKSDAEELTGVEVLGLIPNDARATRRDPRGGPGIASRIIPRRKREGSLLTVDLDPFSTVGEAYRTASLNLTTAAEAAGAKTVLVTSAMAGEGKSTSVANVAVCNAERGAPTVVVSGDLRQPHVHDLLDAQADPGLSDLLSGDATVADVEQILRPGLRFVGCGTPTDRPDRLVAGADLPAVLKQIQGGRPAGGGRRKTAAGREAVMLIDGPPLLQAAETLALARAVDGVVLVVRAGITKKQAAVRAVEQIERRGARLLGVVMVGVSENAALGLDGSNSPYPRRRVAAAVRDDQDAIAG